MIKAEGAMGGAIEGVKGVEGVIEGKTYPAAREVWDEYLRGRAYNMSIDYYERTRRNENFYNGDQWEGLIAPDLEKPVLNFLKRAVNYCVAMLISDDIGVEVSLADDAPEALSRALGYETERVMEHNALKALTRDALLTAAVTGDGAIYLRYDPDADASKAKGGIVMETVPAADLIFGDPYKTAVERQPYLIMAQRQRASDIKRRFGEKLSLPEDGLVTVLLRMWKDEDTGTVFFMETVRDAVLTPPTDTLYRRYPLAFMNWERSSLGYHGHAAITPGLIENQIYVNTMWALFMIHHKKTAFPKIFYDATRIDRWTNRVGQAVAVMGSPSDAVLTSSPVPDFSDRAMELVEKTIAYSKEFIGATDAALGNIRPDNAAAIIAAQQAAAAPLEIQRQAYYRFVEDIVRIILEIIITDYGRRTLLFEGEAGRESVEADFTRSPVALADVRVEVGAASYWSELMQVKTADNLFTQGIITDAATYLASIPPRYVRNRRRLISAARKAEK